MTSVSATIGGIIPPSIGMIILATVASLSVGALFSGGIIPGIIIGMALMVITWFIAKRRNYERSDESWNIKRVWRAFTGCFLALSIPIVLVGSIVGGIASPVEAGALTAITAFLLGLIVYRSLDADILMGAITRAFKTRRRCLSSSRRPARSVGCSRAWERSSSSRRSCWDSPTIR